MSSESPRAAVPAPAEPDARLERAMCVQLDGLLQALDLESLGDDRFRAGNEPSRFPDRLFGGQTVAQALLAAGRTAPDKLPNSLHAYFVAAGSSELPLELAVERVRDGRSVSVRRVTLSQEDRTLLVASVSLHAGPLEPELADPPPASPRPETLPRLQDWIRELPEAQRAHAATWVERPPPLEMRFAEPLTFLGGPRTDAPRVYWLRLPRQVGDDPGLQQALLAYASDYFPMDAAFRRHPQRAGDVPTVGFSLDHALWFHRPVHLDRWHQYTTRAQAVAGHRALVRGFLHDDQGRLVASLMQENLIRTG